MQIIIHTTVNIAITDLFYFLLFDLALYWFGVLEGIRAAEERK